MSEAPKFSPAEAEKPLSSRSKKSSRPKSGEEIGAALAEAGRAIEAQKAKKAVEAEKTKRSLEKMRKGLKRFDERTTKILAEKEKAKENEPYESYEVSAEEPAAKTGAAEKKYNKNVISRDAHEAKKDMARKAVENKEKELHANLDRILEAYEEAETVDKFLDYMLETSDMALTKERAESDPAIAEYLKSNFKEQELGSRYEDFIQALPTEQDFMDKARGFKVEEAVKPEKTESQKLSKSKVESEQQRAKESRAEEAQAAYVKAYREYDPGFTKNKSDDLIAVTKPPFLAFGSAARELKRLHGAMLKAGENRASEADAENIRKNQGKIHEEFKNRELVYGPAVEALKRVAQEEEEKFVESNKKFAPKAEEESRGREVERSRQARESMRGNMGEALSQSLVQAYKEMGVNITKDNEASYLVKAPPFSYRFSAKGRKVRDLYDRYVNKLK